MHTGKVKMLKLSSFVERDLEEIADWIAEDNPRRAVSFIQEIRAEFGRIGLQPLLYQLRPEIAKDARLAVVGSYVILFRIAGKNVFIERVAFGGRNLPGLATSRPDHA
jgi:plasmid stabilization system protein ParE